MEQGTTPWDIVFKYPDQIYALLSYLEIMLKAREVQDRVME
jgi:hypothetical protein